MEILAWFLIVLVIIGNIAIMGSFALTNVGMTTDEQLMLTMTSSQLNQLYATSCLVLTQIQGLSNYTGQLLDLQVILASLTQSQISLNETVVNLNETSVTQEMEVLAYNATIEDQMAVLQPKIDNTTTPQLNLTLVDDTVVITVGTVLLSNPNNRTQNITLDYAVEKRLNNTIVKVGQMGDTFMYETLGPDNWVALGEWSPPLFTGGSFSFDQVLDLQRNTTVPVIGTRVYGSELQLVFNEVLVTPQPFVLTKAIEMNIGLV